jgi:hypothetical protein
VASMRRAASRTLAAWVSKPSNETAPTGSADSGPRTA